MLVKLSDLRHRVLCVLEDHEDYDNFHHANDVFHLLQTLGLVTIEDVKAKILELEYDYMNEVSEKIQREAEEDASNFGESFPGEMV